MKKSIVEIEKKPEKITAAFIECVVMPNGEIISSGRTVGWYKDFEGMVYELEQ